MSGGGGGGSYVAPTYTDPVNGMTFTDSTTWAPDPNGDTDSPGIPTTLSGADALNAEIASRQATEKAASDAAKQAAIDQNAGFENTFQSQLTNAVNDATTNANQYFTDRGYDPSMFASQLAAAISSAKNSITDPFANYLAPDATTTTNANGTTTTSTPQVSNYGSSGYGANPSAAFSPNLGANILSEVTTGDQTKAQNAVSSLFAPTYSADNISNSWLDPAVTTALSSQFDPLSSQLTNSLNRGTLNQTGYNAALAKLNSDKTAATSTINNLGSNILASDRTGLDSYITSAKNDAANVNPLTYSSFDPTQYSTGAQDLVSKDQNNFQGDLTNAIGSTSFSSLNDLLNTGGAVQGASDPTATNPIAGNGVGGGVSDAYIAQQALANQKRGLGSQGAF